MLRCVHEPSMYSHMLCACECVCISLYRVLFYVIGKLFVNAVTNLCYCHLASLPRETRSGFSRMKKGTIW